MIALTANSERSGDSTGISPRSDLGGGAGSDPAWAAAYRQYRDGRIPAGDTDMGGNMDGDTKTYQHAHDHQHSRSDGDLFVHSHEHGHRNPHPNPIGFSVYEHSHDHDHTRHDLDAVTRIPPKPTH